MKKRIRSLIPNPLFFFIARFITKSKYDVIIGKKVQLNLKNYFEGKNAIFSNTKLTNSSIGLGTYIANNSDIRRTKIGKFCTIGDHVRTGLGIHPSADFVSIHPAFFSIKCTGGFTFVNKKLFQEHKYVDQDKKYFVDIGNDVWIGNNVLIMDGVKIGDGCIVAAGSIITKDTSPYSIVGGVPAKIIKYRFNKEDIKFLMKVQWWNRDLTWIKENAKYYYSISVFKNRFN